MTITPNVVKDELKAKIPSSINILKKFFKDEAEAAYTLLSFLLRGIVERDILLGYALGIVGLDSTLVQRLLNSLSVYGLISETTGRDGKHYFRLTPYGITALNDYNSSEGDAVG